MLAMDGDSYATHPEEMREEEEEDDDIWDPYTSDRERGCNAVYVFVYVCN